jgi:tRNA pseudouridine32 synthase/23S rRNA pseudouridine746 synthase
VSLPPRPALPLRDGVGASCVVVPPGPWPDVFTFLRQRFPAQEATLWHDRLQAGDVLDDNGQAVAANAPCSPGQRLHYYRSVPGEERIPFDEVVLHHDEDLLVVDKPHFLPVQPGGDYLQETLLVRLRRKLGIDALAPLHRLDRETAGLVLFSTRVATRGRYSALFRDRAIHKTYEAVAAWNPALPWPLERRSRLQPADHFMQQQEVPGTPNAITRIAPLAVHGERALYTLHPETGHRHQLRVHMAALGLPIEGDTLYPQLLPEGSTDYTQPLQLLARGLVFDDPVRGGRREYRSQRMLRITA